MRIKMRLSISNIAWPSDWDEQVYELMKRYGFTGVEIAPTRVFPQEPYADLCRAKIWKSDLFRKYGFVIPSMQSIWYGRKESLFQTQEERNILLDYTKKAIDFAKSLECTNLVFGCPKNRNIPDGIDAEEVIQEAVRFFRELGKYAAALGVAIGMEANPPIYNTNYITDTLAAIALIEKVGSEGFKLNLDVGTMIENHEQLDELEDRVGLINHVHISEPGLKRIRERDLHSDLAKILRAGAYDGFVSIEMGKQDMAVIEETMGYVKEVFG